MKLLTFVLAPGVPLAAFAVLAASACYSRGDASAVAPLSDASADTDAELDAGAAADGGGCPNDLPKSCPTPAPSYARDISPIMSARCLACHGGDGITKFDFTTYASIFARRSSILNQIYGCNMPPADASALEAEERAALLAWLVCRAPDN